MEHAYTNESSWIKKLSKLKCSDIRPYPTHRSCIDETFIYNKSLELIAKVGGGGRAINTTPRGWVISASNISTSLHHSIAASFCLFFAFAIVGWEKESYIDAPRKKNGADKTPREPIFFCFY